MNRDRAREWFEHARVARLATVGEQAQPHLVPVTFALRGDVVVTAVDHKPKSTTSLRRLRNIAGNPSVALLADHYEDDWSHLWWVRADGDAELAEAADHPGHIQALAGKYPQYQRQRPSGGLIVIRIRRWTGWSAAG